MGVSNVEVHVVFDTLIITVPLWRGTSQHAIVNVQVPEPLLFVGATTGARVAADVVDGGLSASGRGNINVGYINAPGPISIDVSSASRIYVEGGQAESATIS